MDPSVHIRDATPEDLERINSIYNWTIVDNHVSFDLEPWDTARRRDWWDTRLDGLDVLVAEIDDRVVGVAYSSFYRPKPAYRSSAETTIVLDTAHLRRGIGTVLLGSLIERLRERGFHRAIAIVALPNDPSIALHHRLGYRTAGTLTEVGHKSGRHWDTALLELDLG
jgi:phosphinothricin acetyltransferase